MKNTIRIFSSLLFALCLGLFATSALAQTSTTGTIEGTVTDQAGAPVPNATVTVSSPNLIREQSAQTNGSGAFQISNLPPGTYKISVGEVGGFGKYEASNVTVNLSKTTSLEVTLQPKGVGADVTVTSGGQAVDVSNNTTGSNVSTEQFSNFPTSRTVQGLYAIAPTVARSGLRDASGRDRDPSVAGSSGPENNYILDGVQTTDPAFGGSGANLPFEFVQEVEIKTGAFGAEYGKSTGGIFNVITKSGGNEFSGDLFAYFTTKGLVRDTKFFPFTGSAPNGFSELDAGVDVGGPIVKNKLWFFGAFNPQQRKNFLFTQTFKNNVENKVQTPFYAGKITYGINDNYTLTFSTFGDFTKQEGFLGGNGFGADRNSFLGEVETGGHNYATRLNSTFNKNWIGEFSFGAHLQRANTIPNASAAANALITDSFAVRTAAGTIVTPTETTATTSTTANGLTYDLGRVAFVFSPNGFLERNFVRQGFGLFSAQDRNRYEGAARLQNLVGRHTLKYGFEYANNIYRINTTSTGPAQTFGLQGLIDSGSAGNSNVTNGFRVTNNFVVCTTRVITAVNTAVCSSAAGTSRLAAAITAGQGPAGVAAAVTANGGTIPNLTTAEANTNPLLVRSSTRVRDFKLNAATSTRIESFYFQDDFKLTKSIQVNGGLRWDYQQAYGNEGQTYLKLNSFKDNLQPRFGIVWDFTGKGRGKVFANYARFLETPIPLDVNVRAGSENSQTDKNFNVSRINAPAGSIIVPGIRATPAAGPSIGAVNLGAEPTPIDQGLKPQTVNEVTAGIDYEVANNLAIGFRGIYRAQGSVIEDGSFDDGDTYFLFNPGEIRRGQNTTEERACLGDVATGRAPQCFGRARRYYRALEFTATKRFTNNYQFIASYVYSSLTGNYEGLFRNDNGQTDPNITSLFDLTSLLTNTYGRLPNDRPHQFKFNGSYKLPFKLLVSGNFYTQSGIPFDQLIPHPVYGNNEGFAVPRGTAVNPITGKSRTPTTYQLDMGLAYPIALKSEKRELRLTMDWFNVTNAQRAIRQDTTFTINSGVAGVAAISNPFFGQGQIYQFPTALRFGVKLKF